MQYHINIFGHHEITLFPPSQLVSAAEILLIHLWKYYSKQVRLIANVLTRLIMISDCNFTYFSIIWEHSKTFFIFTRFYAWDTPKFRNLSLEGATFHLFLDRFLIWYSYMIFGQIIWSEQADLGVESNRIERISN